MKVTICDWTGYQLDKRCSEYKHGWTYEWSQEQLNDAINAIFATGLNVMIAHNNNDDDDDDDDDDVALQVDYKRFTQR